jgi:outer membrane protein assembly factor BamA
VNLEIGPRPVVQPGVLALSPQVAGPEPPDQTPGSGIRLLASAAAVPAVLDVEKTYARIEGQVVAHTGSNNVQLAFRLGGARVFGDYPYFDAAYIGGTSARAYRNQRFGGDASVFANLDLRAFLTGPKFTSVFPVRFGVIGFVDAGRVWLSGERSGVWHPSVGGGVMAKPLGTNLLLRFVGAYGSEGTLIYAGSGFQF